ncbi:MAG TPA: peptide chain release factor 1 [Gemmatimonadota bacterium]|nr:peptide chain release factor 1 [Gemmatimonadota bacterium]
MELTTRIEEIRRRHAEIEGEMASPGIARDPKRMRELAREHSRTGPIIEASTRWESAHRQLSEARQILRDADDPDLREMARAEIGGLEAESEAIEDELRRLLVPRDPLDDKDAVLEIRAGTGGEEAALFAGDLFRMYSRYADRRGWSVEVIDLSESDSGGVREVVAIVHGGGAYGTLRHESGVHRVQRVPATESQGRIHTSAATVAVLPEAEEVDVQIADDELKIDVFRSSGPGGQSVNTTDSAVRITHLPTGLVVQCQDEKSQHKNKAKALKVLRSRLLDARIAEQEAERASARKAQVGTGDRSAKIRTYNFPQSRVTDHRIHLTLHRLDDVLGGDLEELVESLALAEQAERIGSG